MDYVLQTDNLTKAYQKSKVVNHVSMHVKQGDIYGFIGRNVPRYELKTAFTI